MLQSRGNKEEVDLLDLLIGLGLGYSPYSNSETTPTLKFLRGGGVKVTSYLIQKL